MAKIEKKNPNGRQQFILTKESYYLRTLQKEEETKDKIPHTPKYLGEGFHDGCQLMKMEYVEYGITEYLDMPKFAGKLTLIEIGL